VRLDGRITRLGEGSQAESFDDMARDLARFLVRLSRGEAPGKE
jgi:hypothetical protein